MSPLNVKQVFCSQWSCRAVTPPAGGTTVLLVPDGAAGTGRCRGSIMWTSDYRTSFRTSHVTFRRKHLQFFFFGDSTSLLNIFL